MWTGDLDNVLELCQNETFASPAAQCPNLKYFLPYIVQKMSKKKLNKKSFSLQEINLIVELNTNIAIVLFTSFVTKFYFHQSLKPN